ncbi:MAG: alkaline phosphatase family protein [Rhodoferax sp.]|nr:alkaline phosphatase family protein [Rhodoferax sp.]
MVFLAIDGLPMRQVTGYRDQLAPDGFNRFLQRGVTFNNAFYGHGYPVTAPGHATMLSGAYPHKSGIIGNEWRDPATGAYVYCTQDDAHTYIGNVTVPMSGTSPKNMLVETVGDVLRRGTPESKVIAISSKDRGAILLAGHAGTAYMYMDETGIFASSTYYMKAHPQWVNAFNAAKPADAYFKKTWAPLLPESAYQRSVPDGQTWHRVDGNANRLPVVIGESGEAPGPRFYGNLIATPFSDALTLAFARAAIAGESLGKGPQTDILAISLSGHDYVNHAFGPESRLSHDHFLHLDRTLQTFFADLDRRIGKNNYVVALTTDHGFLDTPEWAQSQGRIAGRLNPTLTLAAVNAGLSQKYGDGKWATGFSAGGILLNANLMAVKGLASATLAEEAKSIVLEQKGVLDVFTRVQLSSTEPTTTPFLAAARNSWHPDRSAQLFVVLEHGWMMGIRKAGTTHDGPHPANTHVPILLYGPRWVGSGQVETRVEVVDIAPTLSRILKIAAPAQFEGKLLPLPAPTR